MYSVSEVDCEGAPIRQHIIHHEHHNLSSKRQCPVYYYALQFRAIYIAVFNFVHRRVMP